MWDAQIEKYEFLFHTHTEFSLHRPTMYAEAEIANHIFHLTESKQRQDLNLGLLILNLIILFFLLHSAYIYLSSTISLGNENSTLIYLISNKEEL